MAKLFFKERPRCSICGNEASARSVTVVEVQKNIYNIYCPKCAKNKDLIKGKMYKIPIFSNQDSKISLGIAIVIVSILFWKWFEKTSHDSAGYVLMLGALVIIGLLKLYEKVSRKP